MHRAHHIHSVDSLLTHTSISQRARIEISIQVTMKYFILYCDQLPTIDFIWHFTLRVLWILVRPSSCIRLIYVEIRWRLKLFCFGAKSASTWSELNRNRSHIMVELIKLSLFGVNDRKEERNKQKKEEKVKTESHRIRRILPSHRWCCCVCLARGTITKYLVVGSEFTHHNFEMSHKFGVCLRASNMTQAHFSRSLLSFSLSFSRMNLVSKYSLRRARTHTRKHVHTILYIYISFVHLFPVHVLETE